MSEKKVILEIKPPKGGKRCRETFETGKFVCPYCSGNREFVYDGWTKRTERIKCTYCEGEGWVRAIVEVRWVAGEGVNS
jgi:hypothetical protein